MNFGSFYREQAVLCEGFCSAAGEKAFFLRTFDTKRKQNKKEFLTDCPMKMSQDCTNKEKVGFFLLFKNIMQVLKYYETGYAVET